MAWDASDARLALNSPKAKQSNCPTSHTIARDEGPTALRLNCIPINCPTCQTFYGSVTQQSHNSHIAGPNCPMAQHSVGPIATAHNFPRSQCSTARHRTCIGGVACGNASDVTLLYAARRSPRFLARNFVMSCRAMPRDWSLMLHTISDTAQCAMQHNAAHQSACRAHKQLLRGMLRVVAHIQMRYRTRYSATSRDAMQHNAAHTSTCHADKQLLRGLAHIQIRCRVMARVVPRIEVRCSTQCRA
jgi:hypothetical protein